MPRVLAVAQVTINVDADVDVAALEDGVDIMAAARPVLVDVTRHLGSPLSTVRIMRDSTRVIPELGIGGFTNPSSGHVDVFLDLEHAHGLKITLQDSLPGTLAHELSHAARILDGPGYGRTLIEALVTEGLATSFQRDLWPRKPAPWGDALTPEQEAELWPQIQSAAGTSGQARRWLFGSEGIPRWTGYTIGTRIVDAFRAGHPEVSWAELTRMPAAAILATSGYDPGGSTE